MTIFFIQYKTIPLPESDDYESKGGAYVNCFIRENSEKNAVNLALASLKSFGWHIVTVEDAPKVAHRKEYLESEPEWLEAFDTAVQDGECYIFHTWPNEAQEKSELH